MNEVKREYPDMKAWDVHDALGDDDRETFDHPRTWGPPVGYAFKILGKYYGRHESTIKDWVKEARSQGRGQKRR